MTKNYFTTNHFTKTIEGSKRAFDRAGKRIEPEYSELLAHMNDNRDYKLVIKENPKKKTYEGLTFDFMENYIRNLDDSESKVAEYMNIKDVFEDNYPKVKSWFLETYGKDINIKKENKGFKDKARRNKIKLAKSKTKVNKTATMQKVENN